MREERVLEGNTARAALSGSSFFCHALSGEMFTLAELHERLKHRTAAGLRLAAASIFTL